MENRVIYMDELYFGEKLDYALNNRNNEVSIEKFIADLNSFLADFYNDLLKEELIHLQEEDFFKSFQYMKDMLK